MNQIFLGQRATAFAAAAEIYFGKPLADVTVAEAAMLAGLPKAPSAYNPISNPQAGHSVRQRYIIDRMLDNGFITEPSTTRPGPGAAPTALPAPASCTPNSWPRRRASWSSRSTATKPTPAA
jgi:membrane carboxypeptidase/penicillin-binding protein